MGSTDFSEYADGWLSIAKIVALGAVGAWTYIQWGTTIFPKESYEQSVRAAQTRTDLNIQLQNFRSGYLGKSAEEIGIQILSRSSEIDYSSGVDTHTIVTGEIALQNPRKFPVQYSISEIAFSLGRTEVIGAQPVWEDLDKLELDSIFGHKAAENRIIEPGGSSYQSFVRHFPVHWCCFGSFDDQPKPIRVLVRFKLKGIHPKTGKEIPNSEKEKFVRFLGFVDPRTDFLKGEDVAKGLAQGVATIASTPDSPYDYYDPQIPDLSDKNTLEVPG
ncbi:MAG: hypothetical protein GY952_08955 [Rhodobacteraceae bacterium]|nr:hypothetical protein [Paracoccaceae bacterium]